jgi:eukaryotic-like serine/threonine-protein kinase
MTLGRPGALLADRYRLDRLVGGNGSAERWQAYDERLARPVTARLTPAAGDAAQEDAAQVALERLARLNHPGVAAVYDVGTVDDLDAGVGGDYGVGALSYAISEWTDGRTLAQIMETGPQAWPRIADWGRQISGALAALHSLGIVHGALGPNSIAIHDDRQVKILDAGLGPVGDGDEAAAPEAVEPAEAEEDDSAAAGAGAEARSDVERDVDDGDGVGGASGGSGEADESSEGEPEGHVDVPVGAAGDVYALGALLWEAAVGAAPAFVERDVEVAEGDSALGGRADDDRVGSGGALGDGALGEVALGSGALGDGARGGWEVDLQPLRLARFPSELAELLAEMLDEDPGRRPTAAVAQQRFGPFAPVERVADTVAEVPLTASRATAVLPTPRVGSTATAVTAVATGLGRRGGSAADVTAAALAAERESERRRRRGLFVGIVLLLAAIGTGVGLLVVNLKPSNAAVPNGGDTGVPVSSPLQVPVTLPSFSPSASPSVTTTSAVPVTTSAPRKSPSPSPSPSPSASRSPSASPSASATNTSSAKASVSSSSSASPDPSGGGASASAGGTPKPPVPQPGA